MNTDKIYLVGFMGAGKTTVARALGKRLGWRVEDIDELIEARERKTVADVFATLGEPYFRAAERDVLRRLLPLRHVIIATGGGTFADADNRTLINEDGVSVWLDLPLSSALDRVPPDGRRPLAADRRQFEALYQVRRAAYQLAHVRMDATVQLEELVERILDWLGY
ncbi:MAG TPA: shikimate kinase [Vicinamibacterales bacterium]|jgi:shikimate kinase